MLGWFAETTLVAAALAALASLLCRWGRVAAEARHALWLVVVLKFLIPPVIAWPLRWDDPRPDPSPPAMTAQPRPLPPVPPSVEAEAAPPPASTRVEPPTDLFEGDAPELPGAAEAPQPDPEPVERQPDRDVFPEVAPRPPIPISPPFDWASLILGCWLVGTIIVLIQGAVRIARFRRTLSKAVPAPGWLVDEVASVAGRLGVRPPRVLIVPQCGSPLLWCLGTPRLILPDSLGRMTLDARIGILAHELAHLVRLDHWVVRLELLAGLIWWWNPVFRLARRRLRAAAEAACDARVVRAYPSSRFAYAEALVNVSEHQARAAAPPLPALGIGAPWAAKTLESRLLMILQDPIRPPSRRPALLALALLALSLPTWTLARPQQPADPPKVEAPKPVDPPKPVEAVSLPYQPETNPVMAAGVMPPAVDPKAEPWTIKRISQGVLNRRWPERNLTFRFVTAGRSVEGDKTRVQVQAADVALCRPSQYDSSLPPAPAPPPVPSPAGPVTRGAMAPEPNRVRFAMGRLLRFDGLLARAGLAQDQAPGVEAGMPLWDRRFSARVGSDVLMFEANSASSGSIPIRWLASEPDDDPNLFDDLSPRFYSMFVGPRPGVAPLDEPRPEYLLDLAGPASLIFNNPSVRTELAGVGFINSVEVVRVAWLVSGINDRTGVHGFCWVAPGLGFAVVRFEAVAALPDGQAQGSGRQTWRKNATGFRAVGDLWLPGQVTYEARTSQGQTKMAKSLELNAAFEDYNFSATTDDDPFKPKLDSVPLDPINGKFTVSPPKAATSLVARLKKAVAESPFGPPRVEVAADKTSETRKPDSALASALPGDQAGKGASNPAAPGPDPEFVRLRDVMVKAQIRWQQIRSTSSTIGDPAEIRAAQRLSEAQSQFELARLRDVVARAQERSRRVQATSTNAEDPAPRMAAQLLSEAQEQLEQARKQAASPTPGAANVAEVRESDRNPSPRSQARHDIQAAEVRRFEAERDRAIAAVDHNASLLARKIIGQGPVDVAQADLKIAEAALDREKAKLAEVDLMLDSPKTAQIRGSDRNPNQSPLLQARRDAQAAEVRKFEARRDLAKAATDRNSTLQKQNANFVSREEDAAAQANLRVAEAEVDREKAKLAEADLMLDQAKAAPTAAPEAAAVGGKPPVILSDHRELVELAELLVQIKRVELQKAESKVNRVKALVEIRRTLAKEGRITNLMMVDTENDYSTAQDEFRIKEVEVRETELRLKQAKRRAEGEEVRLKRLAERSKAELERAGTRVQRAQISYEEFIAIRDRYDDLMFQLDPDHKASNVEPGDFNPANRPPTLQR